MSARIDLPAEVSLESVDLRGPEATEPEQPGVAVAKPSHCAATSA
jgi:hypothetical protein